MVFDVISPMLGDLEDAEGDLLALPLFHHACAPAGAGAYLDWRMHGRLSRLVASAFRENQTAGTGGAGPGAFVAADGSHLLTPGRPAVKFQWVLLFGLGDEKTWNLDRYRASVEILVDTMHNLKVGDVTVIMPPWGLAGITAKTSVELLLRAVVAKKVGLRQPFDRFCLLDALEFHNEISEAAWASLQRAGLST